MTHEQSARVFDAFAQGDGSTTRRYGGTGLGLTICRYLVELMQGQLQLETTPGCGSHFHFVIKLGGPEVATPRVDSMPLAGESALVLAAHPLQRQAVGRLLTGLGARVFSAATVAEAQAVCADTANFSAEPLRLVVADEGLMTDSSLIAQLQSLPATPGLILMWRTHVEAPAGLPLSQMVGRPVTRHALLRAINDLRGMSLNAAESLGGVRHDPRLLGARILVVDDYPLNLEIVTTFLTEAGCVVSTAANGQQALERIGRETVEVVLMDCQMPVMDGFEATRQLRLMPECNALPIIAMTANVMEGDREKCFAAGMNDFVGKPVMIENLLEALVRHLPERVPSSTSTVVSAVVTAQEAPAATVASVDLSRLHGINLEVALASTMGNPQFLERVLRIFHTTQHVFDQKFVAAQADATDPEAAGRAAHTLKGAAASIGAESLRQAALALEQAAKQGLPANEIDSRRADVRHELTPVLQGIRDALSL
jgi:CheY-like chemotaxis protein/HPt (histidine-containing phosphotransfer) domain-containing protein